MSRCFPFPPPGYEKKSRLGDTDLLTKEKHREKKHKKDKKDKKDKKKREGKERKKDKERSDTKHKEKKDQKEKHKDRKDRDKEKKKTAEKDTVVPSECQNGEKLGSNCLQNGETRDSKILLELDKRVRDEGGAGENQTVQSITHTGQRSNNGDTNEGKEKYRSKKEDDKNVNGQTSRTEARSVDNSVVRDFGGFDQKRVEGVDGLVYKDTKKQREGKEKHKHKDSDNKGDRHKDRDGEKKSKSKNRNRTKEKEKAEKAKEKQPNKVHCLLRESNKDGMDSPNIKPSYLLKEANKISTCNGILGKRKELEMNGILHDNVRPNKMLRPAYTSQLLENGRKSEPCQTAFQVACERRVAATNHKVDGEFSSCQQILQNGRKLEPNKSSTQFGSEGHGALGGSKTDEEVRINGLVRAQQLNACSSKTSPIPVQTKEKLEASAKPPHPDSKYLSQILSVPKVAEWSDFDEQEWLFSSNDLHAEKPKEGYLEVDGTLKVWAEVLRIESADVIALPYVIPF